LLEILIVDDDAHVRHRLVEVLRQRGHQVFPVGDGVHAQSLLGLRRFDLVVSDLRLPKVDGLSLLRRIRSDCPGTSVILMSGVGGTRDVVEAMKADAEDYLAKPFATEELLDAIARIEERRRLQRTRDQARVESTQPLLIGPGREIVGKSPPMARLLERIDAIGHSDAAVLIEGESGTGKELLARVIHDRSRRAAKTFVAVSSAAFPDTLLEAELFGHERGAFTGAYQRRDGRFRLADGGTLFLDEIAELTPMAQAKVLRVLQEGTFEPVGSSVPIQVNVRVISATHRNLRQLVAEGRFREDLYYRINTLGIVAPPLRERGSDLELLIEHFLRRFVPGAPPAITPRAWAALSLYPFPGNVRELEHAIEHAVVMARGGEIDLCHLPSDLHGAVSPENAETGLRPLSIAMKQFEREYVLRALRLAGGSKTRAAELLGISRKNLWEKLRDMGSS
jgi:two-component system, NtrC family, response regulator AtoC